MKVTAQLIAAAAVVATSLVSSAAFAQSASNTGETRAQVRAELVAAERAGQLPVSDVDYPPSADTLKHNADLYARSQRFEQKHPHFVISRGDQS
jgi:hypothetical protein